MKKKKVAIIGIGMMGGSIGLAMKKKKSHYHLIGVGRKIERLNRAKKLGACDEVSTSYSKGVGEADIVIVCTPVFEIVPTIQKIVPFLKPGVTVTDIGSVKASILKGVDQFSELQTTFVGGHPLAGSEKTGVENAKADLYRDVTVVLSPLPSSSSQSLKTIEQLWHSIGAKTVIMQPEIHDILVAQTSHLPHVLASAFVQLVSTLQSHNPQVKKLLAGSFRDMTRVVDSDSVQWSQICSSNQKFVLGAIKAYRDILSHILQKVEKSKDPLLDWRAFFSFANKRRTTLLSNLSSLPHLRKE